MDEPFGAVDPIARGRLQESFLDLQQQVLQDSGAGDARHRRGRADGRPDSGAQRRGSSSSTAPPAEILAHPANEFVADFVGHDRT